MSTWVDKIKPTEPKQATKKPAATGNKLHTKKFMYLLANMTGCLVNVTTKGGAIYEGVLHTINLKKGFDELVLKQVCDLNKTAGKKSRDMYKDSVTVQGSDIVSILVEQPVFAKDGAGGASNGFKTDTEISNRSFQERNLERWDSGQDALLDSDNNRSLDEEISSMQSTKWNQMDQLEKSSYKFDDYTTSLDRDSEFYKQNISGAAALANEISSKKPVRDDSHLTESQLFSTVLRKPKDGVYTPPNRRLPGSAAVDKNGSPVKVSSWANRVKPAAKPAEATEVDKVKKTEEGGEKPKKKPFKFNVSASEWKPPGGDDDAPAKVNTAPKPNQQWITSPQMMQRGFSPQLANYPPQHPYYQQRPPPQFYPNPNNPNQPQHMMMPPNQQFIPQMVNQKQRGQPQPNMVRSQPPLVLQGGPPLQQPAQPYAWHQSPPQQYTSVHSQQQRHPKPQR